MQRSVGRIAVYQIKKSAKIGSNEVAHAIGDACRTFSDPTSSLHFRPVFPTFTGSGQESDAAKQAIQQLQIQHKQDVLLKDEEISTQKQVIDRLRLEVRKFSQKNSAAVTKNLGDLTIQSSHLSRDEVIEDLKSELKKQFDTLNIEICNLKKSNEDLKKSYENLKKTLDLYVKRSTKLAIGQLITGFQVLVKQKLGAQDSKDTWDTVSSSLTQTQKSDLKLSDTILRFSQVGSKSKKLSLIRQRPVAAHIFDVEEIAEYVCQQLGEQREALLEIFKYVFD
ncbi:hypothetical protein MIR68_001315 [Amoeboaphelidium protococcarum]|nr:hypothetical protein MIR68_001315 [Amoeboaphelidium protococcarum]